MSLPHVTAIFIVLLTLLSCSSTPRPDIILHEGPEGGVYLERLVDRTIRATQPIKLDRGLVARILNGIQVGEPKTAAQTLFANAKPERMFSDEDTAFLAPLISSALSQATADQQVRFRIIRLVSPIAHPSGGGAGIGSSTPQTGLKEREVQFVPQSALRPDSYKHSDGNTLVIDYDTLAKRPLTELGNSMTVPAAATSAPASASTEARTHAEDQPIMSPSISSEPIKSGRNSVRENDEVRPLKDLVIKKDLELETLKKELRSLRRQLSERNAQLDALRKKGKTSPKSSETLP